ncbi:MAG: 16S rRNA (cytosine(967)-C(5))-methyltransferase RsmB [Candidatus Gastranaerophilales bacterium]|nr:16S rRNA (cytosine(967)-C(5))-methyltransferase RsmB [Candidatus Gastranaerophilales bacterium]
MDVRKAALKSLNKILYKNGSSDDILNYYSKQVLISSELKSLVAGVLRNKLTLDYFIANISDKKLKDLSNNVLNALRLAIYELEFLKTPDYAVLNSYVELIKRSDLKSGAFVNGVLRNFIRKRPEITFPDIEKDPVSAISIKYSHPEWLVERWLHNYGTDDTIKICKYNNLSSKLTIRVNTLNISKEDLKEFFKENEISFSDDRMVNDCLILHQKGDIKEIPGFKEGYWLVQSESSSLVSIVLDPKENEKILDLCSAPGGKTTHIADLMNNKGKIIAVDLNPKRLEKVKENCLRLGISSVEYQAADAKEYSHDEQFDRVLIDAPCSNTGVLAKRIDARWKKTKEDIKNLAKLQLEILNNAAKLVKQNGIIVYSTCSIEPEENQEVITKFLEENKDFKPDKIAPYLPWELSEDKGYFQILQSKQNIDGFFIARLKKI